MDKFYTVGEYYITKEVLDLLFVTKYYKFLNLDILKMTLLDLVFSLVLVVISIIREKTKNGNLGYILERILKRCFRYNVLFIFFIYTFTVSNKFLTVAMVKNIGIALFFVSVVIFSINNFLALRSCSKKNKEKYGKENLIITITQVNAKFCLADEYINPLHIFKKYNTKGESSSLLISGKDSTFVSYDAIKYGLIDEKQYKI